MVTRLLRAAWHWFAHLMDDRTPNARSRNVIRNDDGTVTIISAHHDGPGS